MTGKRLARAALAATLGLVSLALSAVQAASLPKAGCPRVSGPWLRSVWMWHYRKVLRHPQRVVCVLARNGIRRVYLQLAPPLDAYRRFLGLAHRAGIEVFAVDGSPRAVLDPTPVLRHISRFVRFEKRAGPRFQGLQLDVEPYALKRFWTHPAVYLGSYLNLLVRVRHMVPRPIRLSVAIPSWFSRLKFHGQPVSAFAVTIADEVVVMSYRGGLREAQAAAAPVVRQAGFAHKPAYIGIQPEQRASHAPRLDLASLSGYVLESYRALEPPLRAP
ncbi:MAG: hypothetical protein ACYCQK_08625 [Acidiferrobacteraceae bacterium]